MQELLQDINALRRGIEALNKRSLEQGKPVSRAELDEVLARVKQEVRFTIDYKGVAEAIQPHLATPAKVETALTTGTVQLQQVIAQIPRSVPVVGQVWGFTDWRLAMLVLVLVLSLGCSTMYAWTQKGIAEGQVSHLQQTNAERKVMVDWLWKGFSDLKKANPKAAEKFFPEKK